MSTVKEWKGILKWVSFGGMRVWINTMNKTIIAVVAPKRKDKKNV